MTWSDKCKYYVKAGLAYERGETPLMTDTGYDEWARMLLYNYNKLPKWFTEKVSEEDLETASAATFEDKFGWKD